MIRPMESEPPSTPSFVKGEEFPQTLVTGKVRLAKKDLTTPRLELVTAHMAANLVINMKNGLKDWPEPTIYGWPYIGYWETASIANLLQTEYAK